MRTLWLVLAVLSLPTLALAEEPADAVREHEPADAVREHVLPLPPIHVHPRAPVHVFVARSRTERSPDELRATFTDEIVATASRPPF